MSVRAPRCLFWAVFALILIAPRGARAWVETAVRSYEARVEVARDGTAIVRHELVLKVRGGPMKSLEIDGVGAIGDPLPDAIVRRAVQGSAGAWPLTISSLEDGGLRLRIGAERGIRGGSYQFSFAYRLDLKELGRIAAQNDGIEISFIGPRLTSGVDSAKVTFVVPRGGAKPRLGRADETGAGVLLNEVRRGSETDEIELVRAHLAIGEPAIWRVMVDPEALSPSVYSLAAGMPAPASAPPVELGTRVLLEQDASRTYLPLALLLGLVFGLLGFLKGWFTLRAARLSDVRVKPLLPGPPAFRGSLVGLSVAGAAYLALLQQPWWSVGVLTVGCAAATHLLPVRALRPRGPGVWEAVDLSPKTPKVALPGRIFELRALRGFAAFSFLTLAIAGLAYRVLPESNYFAFMTLALELVVVPLFWTGQLHDFPRAPVAQAGPWHKLVRRGIDPEVAKIELWGRRASLGEEKASGTIALDAYDEARIRLVLRELPAGLRALEVSFDEAAGACVMPCVVVRALEDSPAVRALPADVPWQRGRAPEERVAVLRPSAPTAAQLLRLLRSLLTNLRAAARHSSSSLDKSAGSGLSTSTKPAPVAQAM